MSSIQRLGLIVKALLPASAKRGSNSTPLKSGLFSFSHKPRYSNVFFTNGCKNTHLPPNRQAYHFLFLLNLLTLNLSKNTCHFLFFFFVRHRPLRKGRYTYYYRAYPELDAAVRDGWGCAWALFHFGTALYGISYRFPVGNGRSHGQPGEVHRNLILVLLAALKRCSGC